MSLLYLYREELRWRRIQLNIPERTISTRLCIKRSCVRQSGGDSDSYLGGVLGKYIKGKIHDDKHDGETYSERHDKKKFKTSDRKRHESALEKMAEYADVYEYGVPEEDEE